MRKGKISRAKKKGETLWTRLFQCPDARHDRHRCAGWRLSTLSTRSAESLLYSFHASQWLNVNACGNLNVSYQSNMSHPSGAQIEFAVKLQRYNLPLSPPTTVPSPPCFCSCAACVAWRALAGKFGNHCCGCHVLSRFLAPLARWKSRLSDNVVAFYSYNGSIPQKANSQQADARWVQVTDPHVPVFTVVICQFYIFWFGIFAIFGVFALELRDLLRVQVQLFSFVDLFFFK